MGLEIINQRKKKKKLTNEELSVLSGVPKGTIDKITSGATKDPKLETLKALARVLDCSLSDFDDPKERHFAERTDQEVLQNRIHILTKVLLPGSIPLILANMKVNIGLCLVGVIIGEFLAAKQGLGYLIIYGSQVFQMDMVVMSIILLCIMSAALYQGVGILGKFLQQQYHQH